QALLLYNIGDKELTAGELRTRGYYLGSNVSYNLKKLVELGFLDHQRSRVDRRRVCSRLTPQGQEVRRIVDSLYQKHVKTVEQVGGISGEEFSTLNKSLHRLERFWTDQILYRLYSDCGWINFAPASWPGFSFGVSQKPVWGPRYGAPQSSTAQCLAGGGRYAIAGRNPRFYLGA